MPNKEFFNQCALLINKGQPQDAINILTKLVDKDLNKTKEFFLNYYLGTAYTLIEDKDKIAFDYLKKASDLLLSKEIDIPSTYSLHLANILKPSSLASDIFIEVLDKAVDDKNIPIVLECCLELYSYYLQVKNIDEAVYYILIYFNLCHKYDLPLTSDFNNIIKSLLFIIKTCKEEYFKEYELLELLIEETEPN